MCLNDLNWTSSHISQIHSSDSSDHAAGELMASASNPEQPEKPEVMFFGVQVGCVDHPSSGVQPMYLFPFESIWQYLVATVFPKIQLGYTPVMVISHQPGCTSNRTVSPSWSAGFSHNAQRHHEDSQKKQSRTSWHPNQTQTRVWSKEIKKCAWKMANIIYVISAGEMLGFQVVAMLRFMLLSAMVLPCWAGREVWGHEIWWNSLFFGRPRNYDRRGRRGPAMAHLQLTNETTEIHSPGGDHGNATTLKENFDEFLKEQRHSQRAALVMFHVSWCKACQRTFPTFAAASNAVIELEVPVAFAHVECTDDKTLCQRFQVQGYPTIKFLGKKWQCCPAASARLRHVVFDVFYIMLWLFTAVYVSRFCADMLPDFGVVSVRSPEDPSMTQSSQHQNMRSITTFEDTLWWTNIAMENHHFSWENPL